jgi:hypothetical protein
MEDENPIAPETETPTVAEESNVPTSSVDEPTTSTTEVPEGEVTSPVEEPVVEHKPERPAESRIRSLVSENKRLAEENRNLTSAPIQAPQTQSLSSILEGKESVSPEELDQIGKNFAAQSSTATAQLEVSLLRHEMAQEKAVNQFENDANSIQTLYPQLDEKSSEYNPVLDRLITEQWEAQAIQVNPSNPKVKTLNPNIRLADVAKRYMEAVQSVVETTKANTAAVLDTQRSEAALTPNSEPATPEKPFEELSLKEMETKLRAQGLLKGVK